MKKSLLNAIEARINTKVHLFLLMSLLTACNGCISRSPESSQSINVEQIVKQGKLMPIAIIGSGPAGLMAGTYGARGGKKTYIIEGNKPGGLLMDTTEVENWPGELLITGPKIIEKMRMQAEGQGVQFVQDAVSSLDVSHWPYRINFESGDYAYAMSIIVATGSSPRKLGVPGEETYWGSGVTSCAVCDAPFFKDEEVVVVGGGDSAVEEAIQLSPFAKKITILVRNDQMRAAASMQNRLQHYPKISIRYGVEVKEIKGDLEGVTGVLLYSHHAGATELFPTAGVFLAIGHIPNSEFIKNVVKTDAEGNIIVNRPSFETSVPGIFAAGDIEDKRYRQASTSAGRGSAAGLDAVRFLEEKGYTNEIAKQLVPSFYATTVSMAEGAVGSVQLISSSAELEQLVEDQSDKLVVLDFWTEDCSSCKQLHPIIEQLASEHVAEVAFVSIDGGTLQELAEQYGVNRAPTIIALKQGKIVDRHTGFLSKNELKLKLQKLILE